MGPQPLVLDDLGDNTPTATIARPCDYPLDMTPGAPRHVERGVHELPYSPVPGTRCFGAFTKDAVLVHMGVLYPRGDYAWLVSEMWRALHHAEDRPDVQPPMESEDGVISLRAFGRRSALG